MFLLVKLSTFDFLVKRISEKKEEPDKKCEYNRARVYLNSGHKFTLWLGFAGWEKRCDIIRQFRPISRAIILKGPGLPDMPFFRKVD